MKTLTAIALTLFVGQAWAGVVNPDCTAEKAVKSAATKAAVGVGGRCDVKEAAGDSAKKAAGVDDKGVVEKKLDNGKPATKAVKAIAK